MENLVEMFLRQAKVEYYKEMKAKDSTLIINSILKRNMLNCFLLVRK